MSFTSVPIIDFSLAKDPATKPQFLEDLKHALFTVGFLYLINHGLETEAKSVLDLAPSTFDLPSQETKNSISMVKSGPYFVGYSALGAEFTNKALDFREQYDFGSSETVDPLAESRPDQEWRRLRGPSPYLPDDIVPGFESTVKTYLNGMNNLAEEFLKVVAECLNLPADTLLQYQDVMNRLKIVKYPPPSTAEVKSLNKNDDKTLHNGTAFQGVGPHKDSSNLFTFVLQDNVGGLEVLNSEGKWIPVTPIENSFVVNIAQGFEALTGGRCSATTHQVVVDPSNKETRYSIPYFHGVRLDLTREDIEKQLSDIAGRIPEPKDQKKRAVDVPSEFIQPQYKCFGEAHLRNRVVSHKDVAERWYADLHQKYNNGQQN
ncbi:hypothetical protein DV495_001012 [Geotrichum candidum]|uniref:Fe2OG dioxygenase domain-containing protein n=1 Tax=Geotrichum candidum TaxID=1173061 RepID=A0A0J9XHI2_GEOCN|nr:hypothetical protein DV454_003345 [Geotrichum candidum]KAI9210943.1 hypothetical protein DS838_004182 [Geotrichum bryndzae]KAF5124554.1 hypothetical protein DV452_000121 [Geotrichum candidum]KAF5135267.1 hypothetical protein DV495_001012 [Geotrichum candidum]KAF7499046.1 hypothetical protein DV113_002919 [Geotrichum candidum]